MIYIYILKKHFFQEKHFLCYVLFSFSCWSLILNLTCLNPQLQGTFEQRKYTPRHTDLLDFRLECNTQFKNIFSSFAIIAFFPPSLLQLEKNTHSTHSQLGTNWKGFTNVTTGTVLSDIMTAAFGYSTAVSPLKHVACPSVPLVTVTVYHEVLFVHMSVHTPQEVWGIAPCQRPEARVYLR